MRKLLLLLALLILPGVAGAVGAGCTATTGTMVLSKANANATGAQLEGCYNSSMDTLSSAAASSSSVAGSTATLQAEINAINTTTGTIAVSTVSLQAEINAINTTTGTIAVSTAELAGTFITDSSSMTNTSASGLLVAGGVSAASGTFTNGVTASSFTATGTPGYKGDLSNGTGLPLATGVSGQLPVLNGGTAATTASGARTNLSAAQSGANNDITSMSALTTISSHWTSTSSGTVTGAGGLGVTYGVTAASAAVGTTDLVTDPVNHRVGIGTSSPATKLHLSSGTLTIDGNVAPQIVTGNASAPGLEFTGAQILSSANPGTNQITVNQNGAGSGVLQIQGGSNIMFDATSGVNYFRTGNVAINTPTAATTLDVNGSAQFGSGATKSTFTATGNLQLAGYITTTSSVNASAFFGDGSHMTNISGTLGGLTAGKTATASGSNTLGPGSMYDNGAGAITVPSGSSMTFAAGSTTTVLGYSNVETFLSSQSFTAATSFSFGLTPPISGSSATIRCEMTLIQNTASGHPLLTFNGDAVAGHYPCFGYWQGAGGAGGFNCGNASGALAANITLVGSTFGGAFHYKALPSASTTAPQVTSSAIDSGSNEDSQCGGFTWTGGSAPSYGTITASAGTMTGKISCTYMAF